MRILIDIGHPAHVHYFKNLYRLLVERGDQVLVVARDKEVSFALLESYGIPYVSRGQGSSNLFGKLLYLPKANWFLFKHAKAFQPDLFLSFSSPYAAQVSTILRKPHVAFDDTENARLGRSMYRPFTNLVLSPSCYEGTRAKNQEFFNGYMELCYLHPNHFQPRRKVRDLLGLGPKEKYTIVRFVSWGATHDITHTGLSIENKRAAIREFSKYGRVLVSSEGALPDDIESYRFNLEPDWMHDAICFAELVYGESATMASEAAMLGVPAIYLDNEGRGYTNNLENEFGLVFNFSESEDDQRKSIELGVDVLNGQKDRSVYKQRHKNLLKDAVDVTAYALEVIRRYDPA